MRVALLSDAHVDGPDDPRQARLVDFLERLDVDRLAVLGDLFQRWWHEGSEVFPAYVPVLRALRRFEGRLDFCPGNHDFKAAEHLRLAFGARVGPCLDVEWDGVRVHLAHGDGADASPGYAAASTLLRGRVFAACMRALPRDARWAVLGRLAGQPHGRPDARLIAHQHDAARARMRAGAQVVVYGHTHAPELTVWPEGTYCNLGDWVGHRTWLLLDDGRPTLCREP